MKFNIIVACDKNNGIGTNNTIPWDIKPDMLNFGNQTSLSQSNKKNILVMGKNTWISMGSKPLKNRINIIISSSLNKSELNFDDTFVFSSLKEALYGCSEIEHNEIYIIGGAKLYDEAFQSKNINNIYVTMFDHEYNCDVKLEYPLNKLVTSYIHKHFMNSDKKELCQLVGYDYISLKKYTVYDKKNNVSVPMYYLTNYINRNEEEKKYLKVLEELILKGNKRETRNAITYSLFSKTLEFDMDNGFPLITTKKVNIKNIFHELIWFLKGDTNAKNLDKLGVTVWNGNSSKEFLDKCNLKYEEGDIGPMYGFQLRYYNTQYCGCDDQENVSYKGSGFDQLQYCIDLIKKDPYNRRIIMTTYNPKQAKEGVLYPCHGIVTQFYVENDKLHLSTYQRSADWFLGVVWNIASYSLLLHLVCSLEGINLKPGRVIVHFGDVHLYDAHYNQAITQLLRSPFKFPILEIKEKKEDITSFTIDDIKIINHQTHNFIKAEMIA